MHITQRRTFIIGLCILLVPFLGFPSSWKTFFIFVLSLLLVGLSVKITIPKKAFKRPRRKEKVTPVFVENAPIVVTPEPVDVKTESEHNGESEA